MFGDNLKKYRIQNGFSQSELADRLFVSRQCVSKWENNVTQPDIQTLVSISELLGVSVDALIDSVGNAADTKTGLRNINRQLLTFNILTALFCILSFIVLWRFAKTTVPAHYTGGKIDRYGSRNEILLHVITPVVFAVLSAVCYVFLKRVGDKRALYIVHLTVIAFQAAYFIFVIVLYFEYLTDGASFGTGIAAAFLLCVSVSIHPKLTGRNELLGIRTKHTLANAEVWTKTNRLACYLCVFVSSAVLAVDLIWAFDYSYLLLTVYILPAGISAIYAKAISNKQY